MSEEQTEQAKLKVRYDSTEAKYAAQVILNVTREEIFLDFSSGVVPDPETGGPCVPVHTRIAMTHAGAKRLHGLLGKSLGEAQEES